MFGRITAAAGLVFLSPVIAMAAIAVLLETGSPILFRQTRIGRKGRPFQLLKFRSMRSGSGGPQITSSHDRRITRVGTILRRFKVDEVPQLWNVIRGDMNLVGPRPHPVSNLELFGEGIPYYSLRSAVRPGITGWAQIRLGYANNLEEETERCATTSTTSSICRSGSTCASSSTP